jgi:hypothetical protein
MLIIMTFLSRMNSPSSAKIGYQNAMTLYGVSNP